MKVLNGEQPKIATTPEMSKLCRVTPRTLAEWRNQGLIPFWRVNSRVIRYPVDDVLRALSKLPK
jgi:DNA-binding transcriptional MerR regulator